MKAPSPSASFLSASMSANEESGTPLRPATWGRHCGRQAPEVAEVSAPDRTSVRTVMTHLDNPAGRLRAVFEVLKTHDRERDQTSYRAALAEAFGLDPDEDGPWVLERFAIVVRLPAQIRREVAQLPFDGNLFLRRLPDFEGVLSAINLNGRVYGSLKPIGDGSMESLLLCSDILHQNRPQPVPTDGQRDDLAAQIDELEVNIRGDGSVDDELRRFLLFHLGEMRRALDAVVVAGPVELEAATQRAVGDWVLKFGSDPPRTDASSGFWAIVGRVADILTIAVALQLGPTTPPELAPPVEVHIVEGTVSDTIEDVGRPVDTEPGP